MGSMWSRHRSAHLIRRAVRRRVCRTVSVRSDSDATERVDGLVFLLSLVAVTIVLGTIAGLPLAPLRLPAGLVVGLFAPGYLLLRATVGGRLHGTLRFVLAVPLTLGLAAITGVVLDATPVGVRGEAIGVALCVFSLVLVALALWRGTSPVLPRPANAAPLILDRIRVSSRRAGGWPSLIVPSLLLALSLTCALAAVALKIDDSVDASRDADAPLVLTGRVQSATQTGAARAEARIALTLGNNEPRNVTPLLRLSVAPSAAGTSRPRQRRVPLEPRSTRTIRVTLRVACGGAVRAKLSGRYGARREVTLRITCPRR
jgi:uncharacterized membrane protein